MSRFKVQRMIGFLAVFALLGAPWLTYAQQQSPTSGTGSAKATSPAAASGAWSRHLTSCPA